MHMLYTANNRAADRETAAHLEERAAELHKQLEEVMAQQETVHSRLRSYVYPILTIPNEIVAEILVHSISPYPAPNLLYGPGSPTRLAQICRLWREIAHSTPALWRAMNLFHYYGDNSVPAAWQTSMISAWLARSGSLPLAFQYGSILNPEARGAVLPLLLAHQARWQYVNFHSTVSVEAATLRLHVGNEMPVLRELQLHLLAAPLEFPEIRAPQLRALFIATSGFAIVSPILRLSSWVALTELFLWNVGLCRVAEILTETKNLVRCNFAISPGPALPLHVHEISIPHLDTLIFRPDPTFDHDPTLYASAPILLRQFRAPVLKYLLIDERLLDPPLGHELETLRRFLDGLAGKSRPQLQRMVVNLAGPAEEEYLEAFPNISSISTNDNGCWDPPEWGTWEVFPA
ncbi:F-box domain-containing protein [Mycena kentingensis (nom. inval.)]|nr:F-box domain-containing protein [Mycena kentingensis (nom. inval.)]